MNKTNTYDLILKISISFFLIAALTYNVRNAQLLGLGAAAVGMVLLLMLYLCNKKWKVNTEVFILISLLITIYIISIIRSNMISSIEKIFSLLVSIWLVISLAAINVNLSDGFMRSIYFILCGALILPMGSAKAYSIVDGAYKSIYTTTTFLGIFSCILIEYCYIFYLKSKNKTWWIYILILSVFVWNSKVRTAYIGLFLIIIVMLANRMSIVARLNNKILTMGEYGTWCAIGLFTVVYPNLTRFSWYGKLSNFVYDVTGKILMSGRNIIWKDAFDLIAKNPIWGYGMDITEEMGWSVHNSYLQFMLQFGLIGTIVMFFLIHKILGNILKNKGVLTPILYCFALVNLLMSATEVMLLQGQLIIQILIWALMGIGMNKKFVCST